ncbi:carbohydrate-binding protein [Chitiniphilus purpureus]|uniref:Carbohydrate-binding protein n=1 Tax=Chitiniphilus purpureus TaxID=2981137 RepID=A0ABY6DMV3_9NEIS|nr:carbohydrate-binding protein [Chitiniphilus sp. CD1]UXY15687.1 carbohydrate-binding protein [Chitiniphilus sp. CD1]
MNTLHLRKMAGVCAAVMSLFGPASLAHAYDAWQEGATYATGAKVTYAGQDYEARLTHTAHVGADWNPVATPTLWRALGQVVPTPTLTPVPTSVPCPQFPNFAPRWQAGVSYGSGVCVSITRPYPPRGQCIDNYAALQPHVSDAGNAPPTGTAYWRQSGASVCESGGTPTPPPPPTPTPLTPTPTPTPTPVAVPQWQPGQAYLGGQRICLEGILYEARWWTQGERPDPANPASPWRRIGECPPPYRPPTPTPTPTLPPGTVAPFQWQASASAATVLFDWKLDGRQLGGVAPARWYILDAQANVVLSSSLIYVADDFANGIATYGGSGRIDGVVPGTYRYRLKLCNQDASRCLDSEGTVDVVVPGSQAPA